MREETKFLTRRVVFLVVALGITLAFMFPLVWVILSSLKTRLEIFVLPPKWIFLPTLQNYRDILRSDFMYQLRNSLLVAAISTGVSLVFGSLTAYGFSRYPIRGSENILFWILSLRMLPPIAVVIPFYLLFRSLGLLDTTLALVLVYCIFNISFSIWVLKGFFDEIPIELEEAAKLDGYSPAQVFFRVSLPLVRPGLATTAIFCLIQSLNEFLVALTLTTRKAVTAPVGLAKLQTFLGTDWGRISAAAVIFMIPVVVFTIFVRNELIRGMSFGRMR
ncbi:MAG: carbohydrate ABC transporter permease [Candidatus Caldatribacterium sp.]|uniref:carbohydrate ABC transporter permease n=1 Tax=Candidatus Caldatribacterium sp. TaxID=2282143 RepID=UPI0029922701|nr:carbohydrate ABC transporter permease [Candidatus Caldatribacterium sp.]MCX7731191.1 carbohydrate ABC transporter permease [Candidatus Caldatribacterium sp.]MDW8080342.1 carbohydrate ABC transporter permease [Candidatus Calescibacterium sp.]